VGRVRVVGQQPRRWYTNGVRDVFVHDRQTGNTTRVSIGTGGTQGNAGSQFPVIGADGRWVAFESFASNLVADDTNGSTDVFLHDRDTGETTRISVGAGGIEGNGHSHYPSISADGRSVVFSSSASNLVPGDTGVGDVFVHDRVTRTTTKVSVGLGATEANGLSVAFGLGPISASGRDSAFNSAATNLVPATPTAPSTSRSPGTS
jgi:Tol biopolymer transport system component